jgi:hypothetical protein
MAYLNGNHSFDDAHSWMLTVGYFTFVPMRTDTGPLTHMDGGSLLCFKSKVVIF